jgi:DNA topoisomerase I
MSRIRRVDPAQPGIRRIRCGRGFRYLDADGDPVNDADVLQRLRALAIPPAWQDVWICADPRGHIQAIGRDAAGRKQYRYHDRWRERRDQQKFDRMLEFGTALPKLRRRVEEDLGRRGLVAERVLACAVRLLDLGFFRVGGEAYAEKHGTFGLATLKKRHVRFERGAAVFDYKAKGGERHLQVVSDQVVLPTIRALKRRRGGGYELLAYRQGRSWADVRSDDINAYLKDAVEGEFTAKDFRTWNATVLAAVSLVSKDGQPTLSKAARKRVVTAAIKEVSRYLANSPTVCRNSYIDPRVIDCYRAGETIAGSLERVIQGSDPDQFPDRERIEAAVLRLLRG